MWSITSSLRQICDDLYDPNARQRTQEIQINVPFRPMLCERFNTEFKDIPKVMNNEPFWIETKLDGERMQVHKSGNEFAYFSRKGKDYTELYGKTKDDGTITPFLSPRVLEMAQR